MHDKQKQWLDNALKTAYPDGHEWIINKYSEGLPNDLCRISLGDRRI